ncbi:MAG: AP-3 complex subunit beta [Alyxoria varia]|nr:MAG: AP-3 complex subunit beta [Alyxoria varia]
MMPIPPSLTPRLARNLTIEAARDAGTRRRPTTPQPAEQLRNLLESRHEQEVLEGLRRVISLSQRTPSNDTPLLLPTVLKNISSPNSAIRKLVYIHLLNSAERDQDTALLAVNSIQKALSASDPQLRALALRTMSGLRVPVIAQIVSLAIKKGAGDMSPIVRRAAALAIPKCWRLDPGNASQLEGYLQTLLGDKQYYVAGAAAMAMAGCCPDRIDLLHRCYRSLARKLVDMDEWSQLATLRLLTSYARRCFPRRTKRVKRRDAAANASVRDQGFYDEDVEQAQEAEGSNSGEHDYVEIVDVHDPDLELLLKSAQSLLQSRNSAVIIAVTRLYLALTNPSKTISRNREEQQSPSPYLTSTIGPLISLMRASVSIAHIALVNLLQVALNYPALFVQHVRHFLVRGPGTGKGVDSFDTAALKLEMLAHMFPNCMPHAQSLILMELENTSKRASQASQPVNPLTYNPNHAANSQQRQLLVTTAIRALGRCARSSAAASSRCMALLMKLVSSSSDDSSNALAGGTSNPLIISEALTVLRHLIQTDPTAHTPTVIRLAKSLDSQTHNPQARANIIWLIGEFAGVDMHTVGAVDVGVGKGNIAPDVLRILVKNFAQEPEIVKKQIVLLAAKVYLHYLNDLQQSEHSKSPESQDTAAEPGAGKDTEPSAASSPSSPPISSHPIPKLYSYIHQLVRYDTSYALRDFARTHQALLPDPLSLLHTPSDSNINTQLATLLLHAPKPVPSSSSPSAAASGFVLGSASLAASAAETARGGADAGKASVGAGTIRGYANLPERVAVGEEPDPRLRDEGDEGGYGGGGGAVPASRRLGEVGMFPQPGSEGTVGAGEKTAGASKGKSFDDWLDEDEESGEEGSESEMDEEGSGDSEETEEEEESEEEEEEEEESSSEEEEEEEEESSSEEEAGERVPLTHR